MLMTGYLSTFLHIIRAFIASSALHQF